MDNISIKNNIRRLRLKANLTQEDAAASLGISVTAYKNLESGSTRIVFDRLDLLAATFKASPEEILLGYTPVKPDAPELRDASFREEYIHGICSEYDSRIEALNEKIAEQARIISDLRGYVDAKKRLDEIDEYKM